MEKWFLSGVYQAEISNWTGQGQWILQRLFDSSNLIVILRFAVNVVLIANQGLVPANFNQFFDYFHKDLFIEGNRVLFWTYQSEL